MLGKFLELSLPTPDIQESLEFYLKLGFSEAPVGDTWRHPYAVVTDGRICLGLHQSDLPAPALSFVRPDLLKSLSQLERSPIEFLYRRLGDGVFNEAAWLDAGGTLVRLLEARTFSPSKRAALETSRCGYFLEIALPHTDLERAKQDWERNGFVGIDAMQESLPHLACTSDYVDLGLYDPALLSELTLRFEIEDLAGTLATLQAIGVQTRGALPGALRGAAVLLQAPEGTPLLLTTAGV